jgi:hypothetical protein
MNLCDNCQLSILNLEEMLKEIPKILGILMNLGDNCQFLKF